MKKKIIIALALMLIAFGAYQGTMAVFHQETGVDSPISAGKLGIEIINSSSKKITNSVSFDKILPGAIIDDEISIHNAKDKELYVRITLTRYWVDENGKKVTDANAKFIDPITKNDKNWIIMEDGQANNEIIYFYYKLPIVANEVTSNFIDQVEFDSNISEQRYGSYSANISLEAEAVQMIGAQDAMLSQWGIEAMIDENGKITAITE